MDLTSQGPTAHEAADALDPPYDAELSPQDEAMLRVLIDHARTATPSPAVLDAIQGDLYAYRKAWPEGSPRERAFTLAIETVDRHAPAARESGAASDAETRSVNATLRALRSELLDLRDQRGVAVGEAVAIVDRRIAADACDCPFGPSSGPYQREEHLDDCATRSEVPAEAKAADYLHRGSCVRERCTEDCPKRGTRDKHGRLPDDPLVGTPFPGPVEERADPHGAPMPPLWWDGCEVYGRCGDDYEVVYASMNGQWYPQGAAPLATLPEGAARLVPSGRAPGGHGPALAELDEAIGKVRISEPGDVAALNALRAARDRLADLTDPAALAAPEVAES